jgi:hypothetical protein
MLSDGDAYGVDYGADSSVGVWCVPMFELDGLPACPPACLPFLSCPLIMQAASSDAKDEGRDRGVCFRKRVQLPSRLHSAET